MLDMFMVYRRADGKSVWFKYLSSGGLEQKKREVGDKEELTSLYREISRGGMAKSGRAEVLKGIDADLRKIGGYESYKSHHVDLGASDAYRDKLYRSYLRAKKAAEISHEFFKKSHGLLHWKSFLSKKIRGRYFGNAKNKPDLDSIVDIFQKTADGLNKDGLIISDNAGRDKMMGYVEGIVKFKPETQAIVNAQGRGLDTVAQQKLMSKYLKEGKTNNIRVEFSYLKQYSVDRFARVILHEATHKFGWTSDFAYEGKAGGWPLSPSLAVKNADSYAYAGMSVLLERLVTAKSLKN